MMMNSPELVAVIAGECSDLVDLYDIRDKLEAMPNGKRNTWVKLLSHPAGTGGKKCYIEVYLDDEDDINVYAVKNYTDVMLDTYCDYNELMAEIEDWIIR